MSAKRVLVVTKNNFTAANDGGSKRTSALITSLEASGYEVDWVAVRPLASGGCAPPILTARAHLAAGRVLVKALSSLSLSLFKWFSWGAAAAVAQRHLSNPYDVLVIEHSQISAYMTAARAQVVCINAHNVESELLRNYAKSSPTLPRRIAARYEAGRLNRVEGTFCTQFDIVAVVSDRDGKALADGGRGRAAVVVAPNGVDDTFFQVTGHRGENVVFVGHLGWRPNIDGALWLTDQVWPIIEERSKTLRLNLIGKSPHRSIRSRVTTRVHLHPDVASVTPYLRSAAVATAPLQSAGGTRIKILEALASGTPVVSTSLGALGLEHLSGQYLLIADSPEEFARALLSASSHPPASREEVRALVEGYRWEESMKPFIEAIGAQLRSRGGSR